MKNVKGAKLIEYLNEMKNNNSLYAHDNISQLKNNACYNICCEITADTKDIINIKMPQILKNMYCIKLLNEAYQFFKKEKTKKGCSFSEIYKFYEIETNFIDFSNETVFIILSKGNINLIKELE